MANYRRVGFSVFAHRGKSQLCLGRSFATRETAVSYAVRIAEARPTGTEGLQVRCEVSRQLWTLVELLEVPQGVPISVAEEGVRLDA